jgi:hypothetical protein
MSSFTPRLQLLVRTTVSGSVALQTTTGVERKWYR